MKTKAESDERAQLLAQIERDKARTAELEAQRAELEAGIIPAHVLAEMPLEARWAAEKRSLMARAIRREAEIVERLKAARENETDTNSREAR